MCSMWRGSRRNSGRRQARTRRQGSRRIRRCTALTRRAAWPGNVWPVPKVASPPPESRMRSSSPSDAGLSIVVRSVRLQPDHTMPKTRLDQLVVEKGLAPSRERARALILAGQVLVAGTAVTKAGTAVDHEASVELLAPDHPYVGRGGLKLAHALDTFTIPVSGRECLDIGASTGGFTDVLLQRGAARVVALDVGHGQIDWRLRQHPRVVVLEHVNARHLTPELLPGTVDLVTI